MKDIIIIEGDRVRIGGEIVKDVIDLVMLTDPMGEFTTALGETITIFPFESGNIVYMHDSEHGNGEKAGYTLETFEELNKHYNFQ